MRRPAAPRVVALLVAALALAARVSAHDIPRDVTVQAFVKPEGQRLRLLVRVPLKAVMDVEFPRRDGEYLDLARVDPSLRDAARVWLANKIELYEADTRLPAPRHRVHPLLPGIGPVLRHLRGGAGARDGPDALR